MGNGAKKRHKNRKGFKSHSPNQLYTRLHANKVSKIKKKIITNQPVRIIQGSNACQTGVVHLVLG